MTTEDPEAAAAAPPPLTSPPAAAAQESSPPSAPPPPPAAQLPDSFDQLGLDARLLRGLSKMGISKPTAVQVRTSLRWSTPTLFRRRHAGLLASAALFRPPPPPPKPHPLVSPPPPSTPLPRQNFPPPQALTVPAALEGRDVVARARTGSGKTLAFLLPAFHAVARLSAAGDARAAAAAWRAVALVPTRELAEQVSDVADALAAASGIHLRTSTLAAAPAAAAAAASPRECQPRRCGQLVVSTPGRLASALADGRLTAAALAGLALLAIDEADLLLSLPGYAADLASAAAALPRSAQRLLLSATSAAAVDELGELLLQDPVRIDATGPVGGGGSGGEAAGGGGGASAAPSSSQPPLAGVAASVSHFFLEAPDASDAARLSTLIALLKLGAAKRRVLVFVADDDEGVKLRLALAAFGVRAARLGAALPLSSRHHALQEFNRGVFDYLIATDDGRGDSLCAPQQKKKEEEEEEDDGAEGEEGGGEERRRRAKKAGGNEGQRRGGGGGGGCEEGEDFGVVRGIDFSGVRTVVNFSVPRSATSYVHRAGRTGRAGASGAVVTLFSKGGGRGRPGTAASGERAALEASLVASSSSASGAPQFRLLPYPRLPPTAAAALRYRVDDVARALTRPAVREARAQELRRELLNSSRLAAHFSAAPRDLALLRHDAPLSAAGRAAAAGGGGLLGSGGGNGGGAAHLKRLPSYLMAAAGLRGKAAAAAVAAAASGGGGSAAKRAKDAARRAGGSNSKRTRDDGDPLRSLAAAAPAPEKQPAAAAEKKPAPVFFDRAPKRGGGEEAMTAVEKKAQIEGEKAARRLAKKQAPLLAKVAAAAQLKTAIAKKHRRR